MKLITIDIDKIEEEIRGYHKHISWMKENLDFNPTQAKRVYLAELEKERTSLELLTKLISKFGNVQDKSETLEVKVLEFYARSSGKKLIDKNGNIYHMILKGVNKYEITDSYFNPIEVNLIEVTEFTK